MVLTGTDAQIVRPYNGYTSRRLTTDAQIVRPDNRYSSLFQPLISSLSPPKKKPLARCKRLLYTQRRDIVTREICRIDREEGQDCAMRSVFCKFAEVIEFINYRYL